MRSAANFWTQQDLFKLVVLVETLTAEHVAHFASNFLRDSLMFLPATCLGLYEKEAAEQY